MLVKGLRISGLKSCEQFFDIFYNLLRRNIAMKVGEVGGWKRCQMELRFGSLCDKIQFVEPNVKRV